MIRRPRHVRLSATAAVAGHDTDALQTDVMRFMAIIGLCLMAVFALVQGIPVQEAGTLAVTAQSDKLREIIRTQQQQLQQLQQQLQAMKTRAARNEQLNATVRLRLKKEIDTAQQLQLQRDRVSATLENIQQQLQQAQRSLTHSMDAARQQSRQLDVLEAQLQDSQQRLNDSQQTLAMMKQQLVSLPAKPVVVKPLRMEKQLPPPAKDIPVTVQPVAEEKALPSSDTPEFSLKFSSADALDHLIATGQVSLYIMAGQQAWQFALTDDVPLLTRVDQPRWFHEMSATTVPLHYQQGLAATAEIVASSVTWGVQLPAETRSAIDRLIQGRQGGALVIHADGKVSLQE